MSNPINPAFHRHPLEANLITFSELEIMVARLAGQMTNNENLIMRIIYGLRATSVRIDTADKLIRDTMAKHRLDEEYLEAISSVRCCLKIRNTYSHCHWADSPHYKEAGLFFADLQEAAKRSGFDYYLQHTDAHLLEEQEAFFTYTLDQLRYVNHEFLVRSGALERHDWPKPAKLPRPNLHNLASQHVPPWLDKDQKALHLAHARAAEGGAPTPTHAQIALEAAREGKQAKRKAARSKNPNDSNPPS